ncbi:MAG: hypothetical protein AAFY71_15060 [Bacteroidota bacterium]
MNVRTILFVGLGMLLGGWTFAQNSAKGFDTDPAVFIQEFSEELIQNGKEAGTNASNSFQTLWNGGTFSEEEKAAFIEVANQMSERSYDTPKSLIAFTESVIALKADQSKLKIPYEDFIAVSRQTVAELSRDRGTKFFRLFNDFQQSGKPISRKKFYWEMSQNNPKLIFESIGKGDSTYKGPALVYDLTDVRYENIYRKDSTIIAEGSGRYYPLSMAFIGTGGTVNWEKVGLPADQVYAELGDYSLNMNLGLVKVDTVDFYYRDLIKGSLKGKFEDRGAGFSNVKTANYPFFKSYKGGVVIENLLPNIRYEGGFSMKGLRRIGTSYDVVSIVDEEEEKKDDGYSGSFLIKEEKKDDAFSGESEWDSYEDENSSFDSDESWDYSDESSWDSGSGGSDDGWGGWSSGPYQTVEHIPAKIEIQRKGNTVMKLSGEAFVLDDESMVGRALQATVYTSESDSLYHPSMDVIYTELDSTVTLKKPKRSVYAKIPFTSSFHEYFLYFESIIWDLGEDKIDFTAFIDKENKASAIESYDYFTKARFNKYKGVLKFNPIGAIYRYSFKHPNEPIFPEKIVEEYRLMNDLKTLERALPSLEGDGFIRYDRTTKEITPMPKLYTWGKAARKKKDFDAIQIVSKVDTGSHAKLNLETMELELRGVRSFSMSDSVFVRAVPSKGNVRVGKNRKLDFGGLVAAGRLNFYGNDSLESFHFDYESYRIICDSIDSIRFVMNRSLDRTEEENPLEKALSNTVFEGVTGAIHIDNPNNKSGEKDYPFFPVFDSYSKSYLYWASPDVEGGVYSKDRMYFAVDPFVLDSLETFDPTNLQFDGEFYSSEIFPNIKQRLQVMDDFTLGFKRETPPQGYPIYEGNGVIKGDIILNSMGLQGNGTLEYLGTIAKSDSFVFHFDSVMATVNYFNMKKGYRKGVYFPQVDANTALYKWYTKDSTLAISSDFEDMSLFEGEAVFTGDLKISELGMVGDGTIKLGQVKIVGDSIVFSQNDFYANKSTFVILDEENPEREHFIAENVDINYDVSKHESSFISKTMESNTATFPMHQYKTSLVKGDFSKETYDLVLQSPSADSGNFFMSTHPAMDNLKFMASSAYYDILDKEIEISGVDQILIADARILPDSAFVVVEEGGYLKKLENSIIKADQDSEYHRIYDATVEVNSRTDYTGSGKYDYIEVEGNKQFIEFNDIRVNSDLTTVASGEIEEADEFYLTERIFFQGDARLDASRKFLEFEGEVKIESENEAFYGVWFDFDRTIVNPDSVFIPIAEDLTNSIGEPLTVGLNYYPEGRTFYSTFLQPKEDEDDLEILSSNGGLTFDRKKKEFKIGTREKLQGQVYKGSTVAFNDDAMTITSAGFLKFPYDFEDKTISIKMAGFWKDDLRKRQLSTDLIMGVDMSILPADALEKLTQTFAYISANSKDIDFNQHTFLQSAAELLDEGSKTEKETQKLIQNVSNSMVFTDIKMAEQLPFSLLMSGINFNYDRRLRALYSDSEIGLIGIGGKALNKKVNSKIVYQFGTISADGEKQPDKLTIYLEIDAYNWVYFHFEDETIYTISSYYDEYNVLIQEAVDKRKSNEGYRFDLADEDEKVRFLEDFVLKFIR